MGAPADFFAFTTDTFDCEYMLQISLKAEALVTVGVPSGPSVITQFCVWEGTGLNDDGDEIGAMMTFDGVIPENIVERWIYAVQYAYRVAVERAADKLRREQNNG